MVIIGLTGGTGSGKSTVAKIMEQNGAIIIDADKIARKVVKKGSEALKEIKVCFGEKVIFDDGSLNRKKLGSIVFSDKDKLIKLNKITHKYIIDEIKNKIEGYKKTEKSKFIVIDAALLIELKLYNICDSVCVVYADKSSRIERIIKREDISYKDINNRINCQLTDEEMKVHADYIIENNGKIEELEPKIKNLIREIESS